MASKPVNVETAEARGDEVLDLARAFGDAIEKADPSPADALAALLLMTFIVGRRGYPVVDENIRPFIKDVSTFLSTYDLPVTAEGLRAARLSGEPLPRVPDAPTVN